MIQMHIRIEVCKDKLNILISEYKICNNLKRLLDYDIFHIVMLVNRRYIILLLGNRNILLGIIDHSINWEVDLL